MDSADIAVLKEVLLEKEKEVKALKERLAQLQEGSMNNPSKPCVHSQLYKLPSLKTKSSLTNEDIQRYSRQLVLPELGVKGQLSLANSSVLVVGCGGLGCPLAQYLAASGVGRIGLLDHDVVELSNLHRQILHAENRQGMPKSLSAATTLKQLNSSVECVPYHETLNSKTALELIKQYDVIADCSDNVPTRYLINDACVLTGKPLVSASALRMEGQLTVYNYDGGPCYRCLFPKPPPAETVTNCADGGVLGVVPGIMGLMQALEVLKIISGLGSSFSQCLMMFDAEDGKFRNIKLRPKKGDCAVCGDNPSVKGLQDYEAFCGSSASDKCRSLHLLSPKERISPQEYKNILEDQVPHVLIDVRPQVEVDICHLPHSLNIPLSKLEERNYQCLGLLCRAMRQTKSISDVTADPTCPIYVVCKLGNDSQKAVKLLEKLSGNELDVLSAKDITGGLMAWAKKIDPTFPQY